MRQIVMKSQNIHEQHCNVTKGSIILSIIDMFRSSGGTVITSLFHVFTSCALCFFVVFLSREIKSLFELCFLI